MTDPVPRERPALDGEVALEIIEWCRPIAAAFSVAGFRLHLVGGIVRDLLVAGLDADRASIDLLDLDFTTDARPPDIKALVAPLASSVWTQGERFGTIGATMRGRLVEITSHRAEAYDPTSRKPSVTFGLDVVDDLARRDFTVNAMALELTADSPVLIDPFGGRADLEGRRLRTPRGADESFGDDPLRMLRAARFVARLDLAPDPDVVDAATRMADRIEVVSAERVRDELDKLLVTADPAPGLRFLVDTTLAAQVIPELVEGAVDERIVRLGASHDRAVRWALAVGDGGVSVARRRLRALRCSRHDIDEVTRLLAAAVALERHEDETGDWADADVRRYVARHGRPAATIDLVRARNRMTAERLAAFERRYAALSEREDLEDLGPPVDGGAVIDRLGVAPGPVVGEALAYLRERRIERGPSTADEALAALDEWWVLRSPVSDPG